MGKIRVVVLMGGESSEREVSLASGAEVIKNIDKDKYEVSWIDVPGELEKLRMIRPEVAFLVLHGRGGEDGNIQGYLGTLGIRYIGSGVLTSAIGMDKRIFRKLTEKEGILMAPIVSGSPCVVKPVGGGSSLGVSIVKKVEDMDKALKLAKLYDEEVIIEEYIEGREVSCGVLGNEEPLALPVIEIRPKKKFFDYEAKYKSGMSEEICPAEIGDLLTKKVQETAIRVFKIVGARGVARVDMIIREGDVYVLEINTLPGMTAMSLLPKEAAVAGISYSELLDKIINLALE